MYAVIATGGKQYRVQEGAVVRIEKLDADQGASVEFSNVVNLPKEQMSLTIARKGRSFLAKIVWWRDNFVGLAFRAEAASDHVVSDIEERLRKSEQKKRQLQRRIKELIGEG